MLFDVSASDAVIFSMLTWRVSCSSRVWYKFDKWVATGRRAAGNPPIFRLAFTWLETSNSNVGRMRYLMWKACNSQDFKNQFPMISRANGELIPVVRVPESFPLRDRSSKQGCVTHYDCRPGLFCNLRSLQQAATGSKGYGGPTEYGAGCDSCKFCNSDFRDSVDMA